jgi:hypothetical protein
MKTLVMAIAVATLMAGCAVVPIVPYYDSSPYYGSYYSAPPAAVYGYSGYGYYGPRYYGSYGYYGARNYGYRRGYYAGARYGRYGYSHH